MYIIRDREAGNEIDRFSSLEEAEKELEWYETEDRNNGVYTRDFYEIVEDDEEPMQYADDHREITIEFLEELLTEKYGASEYDRTAGCYSNGHWFSVKEVLALVANNI